MSTDSSSSPYSVPVGPRRRRPPGVDDAYVVGLTGGLASGKSTVARVLVEQGARLLEADRLGHRVLEDPEVRSQVAAAFGAEVLAPSGEIRREVLGRRAFASPESLARLNAISHPRLLALLRHELDREIASGVSGLLVVEAALLVEWDLGSWCDEVVAVVAPLETRRERARATMGRSRRDVDDLLLRQLPDAERVRYADRVLTNDGSEEDLARRARELGESLRSSWRSRRGAGAGKTREPEPES